MNTEMKNRIFFGTLMIAVMLLVVFLSPLTRLLGFLAVGIACAWEYKTRLGEKDIPVAFWILVLFDIAAAVLAWTHQVLMGWPVLLGASVMLTMGYGVYEKSRGGVLPCIRSPASCIPDSSFPWSCSSARPHGGCIP